MVSRQAEALVQTLKIALNSFELEYGHLPALGGGARGNNLLFRSRGGLVDLLRKDLGRLHQELAMEAGTNDGFEEVPAAAATIVGLMTSTPIGPKASCNLCSMGSSS